MKQISFLLLSTLSLWADTSTAPSAPPAPDATAIYRALATLTAAQSRDAQKWETARKYFEEIAAQLQSATQAYQQALTAACPTSHTLDLELWTNKSELHCIPKPIQSAPPAQKE